MFDSHVNCMLLYIYLVGGENEYSRLPNVAGGEYSDVYIYHLVMYISYVFDRWTILFILHHHLRGGKRDDKVNIYIHRLCT